MCKAIDNPSGGTDLLSRLYGAVNVYYNYTGSSSCFDLNSSDPHGESGWSFQVEYCSLVIIFFLGKILSNCTDGCMKLVKFLAILMASIVSRFNGI